MARHSRIRVFGLATALVMSGTLAVSTLPARADADSVPATPSAAADGGTAAASPGTTGTDGTDLPPTTAVTTPAPSTSPAPTPEPTASFAPAVRYAAKALTLRRDHAAGAAGSGTVAAGTSLRASRTFAAWTWVSAGTAEGWVETSSLLSTRSVSGASGKRWLTARTTLRSDTNAASAAVVTLDAADTVALSRRSGDWYLVSKGSASGWVAAHVLASSLPVASAPATYRWSAANVSLRAGTSSAPEDRRLATIPVGAKVKVTGTAGPWSRVVYGGKTGFVRTALELRTAIPVKKVSPYGRFTTHATPLRRDTSRLPFSTAVATLPEGTKVTVVGTVGPWAKVKVVGSSRQGYVLAATDLSRNYKYAFAVFGTLRKGQRAAGVMSGYRIWQTNQRIPDHRLYMNRNNGLTFITAGRGAVVAEHVTYSTAKGPRKLRQVDRYELGVKTPKGAPMYQRSRVRLADGSTAWSYVATAAGTTYLLNGAGKLITSGDFTKRYRS